MRCYSCDSTETEELKYFRGSHLGSVWTCSDHKEGIAEKNWEDVSGISFTSKQTMAIRGGFAPHDLPSVNTSVPTSESTYNNASPYAPSSQYSGLVSFVSGAIIPTFYDANIFCYISGSNVTCIDPLNNTIVCSGSDAATTLQSGINFLQQGQTLTINRGTYNLTSSLMVPSSVAILGVPGIVGGTQLSPISGTPAITLSGTFQTTVRDFYLTHNQPNYNSALLTVTALSYNNTIRDMSFFDNNNTALSGVAIQIDNAGHYHGPAQNFFEDFTVNGFNCILRILSSGIVDGRAAEVYLNYFINQNWLNFGNCAVQFVLTSGNFADFNTFTNIDLFTTNPTNTTMFDYATQVSGDLYKHTHHNVIATGLQAGVSYATVTQFTEIAFFGCLYDWNISGTGNLKHYSRYTNDQGTTNITSSGVGTKSWFIPYNNMQPDMTNNPTSIIINAGNSGTAAAGSPFISNVSLSGFFANAPNAVNSGVALSWNWTANL